MLFIFMYDRYQIVFVAKNWCVIFTPLMTSGQIKFLCQVQDRTGELVEETLALKKYCNHANQCCRCTIAEDFQGQRLIKDNNCFLVLLMTF